jgi:hypothetical protein
MPPYDYTDAPPPRERDLIPAGTIVALVIHLRQGNCGEDGMLKRSKDGKCEMLDIEYTVRGGPHDKRKLWENMVLKGTTLGQQEMADTNRGRLGQMINSALGLQPNDKSPEARGARQKTLPDFEGMAILVKIGVEKGGPKKDSNGNLSGENYPDKNTVAVILTPDKREWQPVEQPPPFNGGGTGNGPAAAPNSSTPSTPAAPAAPVQKPKWA